MADETRTPGPMGGLGSPAGPGIPWEVWDLWGAARESKGSMGPDPRESLGPGLQGSP